jgi:hypothetical protein
MNEVRTPGILKADEHEGTCYLTVLGKGDASLTLNCNIYVSLLNSVMTWPQCLESVYT